ncbi:unnamed protein product, partial [Owenia fusiformis]
GSPRSRSGSPRSQRSRSGSPRSQRDGSPHSQRSRSGSPGPRSPMGSPSSPVQEAVTQQVLADESEHPPDQQADRAAESGDESDKGSVVGELIADIFGSSDEEEFEGFGEDDVEKVVKEKQQSALISDDEDDVEVHDEGGQDREDGAEVAQQKEQHQHPVSSSDDELEDGKGGNEFVSDFDIMMAKKKEEQSKRRRKRKDVDLINDSDDLITAMLTRMKDAAAEDRELNQRRQPATRKLRMLPQCMQQLRKSDLQVAFLDCGILSAITEWLAPLPDKSLPHVQIRSDLLKILQSFPSVSSDTLKNSGIGKAIMYLFKHPKELKQNREIAGKLIHDWSRPIFNLTTNHGDMSKEEREQRDYDQLGAKRRRL